MADLSRAQVCERNRDVTGESRPSLASHSLLSSCLKSPVPSLSLYSALSPDLLSLLLLLSLYFFSLSVSLSLSPPSLLPTTSGTGARTRECFLIVACLPFLTIVMFLSIHFEGYSFLSD